MELNSRLQDIVRRLEELQRRQVKLIAENDRLRAENHTLNQRLEARRDVVDPTEPNISEHVPMSEQKQRENVRATLDQDIRQQIDHYLSEIDKCIEWLGRQ